MNLPRSSSFWQRTASQPVLTLWNVRAIYNGLRRGIWSSCLFVLLLSTPCRADNPLWELGLFNGVARIPHYRGSDEYEVYALPLPFFIYRGKFVHADREGIKGILLENEYFKADISFSGNPPVSKANKAREGMPSLDALVEAGPMMRYYFSGRHPDYALFLQTPLRLAYSVDFQQPALRYEGLKYGLHLVFSDDNRFEEYGFRYTLNLGLDFADRGLNRYFYAVDPLYAQPERPAYKTHGGYAGSSVALSGSKVLAEDFSLGFYVRWINLKGAIFADSPLVKREDNFIFGCAVTWTFRLSDKRVESE